MLQLVLLKTGPLQLVPWTGIDSRPLWTELRAKDSGRAG